MMMDAIRKLLVEDQAFSGLVALDSPENSFKIAAGYASRVHGVKNTAQTRFATASVTKGFTAAAILRYRDQGKLDLNDPIGGYLELAGSQIDPSITLLQLLDHTSGIADYFDEDLEGDYEALWRDHPTYRMQQTEDFFPLFSGRPPVSRPGEEFSYCNAGFILLGMVLERLSGVRYRDVIRREVFEPLGMDGTDMDSLDHLAPKSATHYLPDGRSHIYAVPIVGGPDGGTYTTAEDLKRFWEGLLTPGYLDENTRALLLMHDVPVSGPFCYGVGFWRKIVEGNLYKIYLRGEDPGVSVMSGYYPESGTILSVFSNNGSPTAQKTMAIEVAVDIR